MSSDFLKTDESAIATHRAFRAHFMMLFWIENWYCYGLNISRSASFWRNFKWIRKVLFQAIEDLPVLKRFSTANALGALVQAMIVTVRIFKQKTKEKNCKIWTIWSFYYKFPNFIYTRNEEGIVRDYLYRYSSAFKLCKHNEVYAPLVCIAAIFCLFTGVTFLFLVTAVLQFFSYRDVLDFYSYWGVSIYFIYKGSSVVTFLFLVTEVFQFFSYRGVTFLFLDTAVFQIFSYRYVTFF